MTAASDRARPLRRLLVSLAAVAAVLAPTTAVTQLALAPSALAYKTCAHGSHVTVRLGSTGASVREVQCILNVTRGAGLAEDSNFGQRTHNAVVAFQTAYGLQRDGVVGAQTWAKLHERYYAYVCQQGGPC